MRWGHCRPHDVYWALSALVPKDAIGGPRGSEYSVGARADLKVRIWWTIRASPQRLRSVFIRSLKRFIRGAFFLSLGTFATSMLIRC